MITNACGINPGAAEREKTEAILPELHPHIQNLYIGAKTCYDGKWLTIAVDEDGIVEDVKMLLEMKRKRKKEEMKLNLGSVLSG